MANAPVSTPDEVIALRAKVAQVSIKPKGISKKKRTIWVPEFRHYTEVQGRFTDLLPVKEGDVGAGGTLH
ncbi:hypothetical protein [Thauera sp. 2A1]|uniref:hypothetical protein n=1 Tax=Thauera sp. 2A1 TaxID=2570191 RepID=UPI001884A812|nr:hypothetical protein [Thauera sp. 2A1]KAI5912189.1 hypothetical protein GH664_23110 [Thauera sp. 2A1]KAI5915013.1 hypothetical protein GH664_09365 [Thauera sp. 2A1]